jgi:hypothetical protein
VKNLMTLWKEVFHCQIQPQALPRSNITTDMMKHEMHASISFLFFYFIYQITTWLLWANNCNEKSFMKLHKISWNHALIILNIKAIGSLHRA